MTGLEIPSKKFNLILVLWEDKELASISSHCALKIKHDELPIDTFWIDIKEEYLEVDKKALSVHILSL